MQQTKGEWQVGDICDLSNYYVSFIIDIYGFIYSTKGTPFCTVDES